MTAEVRDLFFADRPVEATQKPQIHHDMERCTEILQAQFPDMVGFVMFAIQRDGHWMVKNSVRDMEIMGNRMLAGCAIEGIREVMVTEKCVDDEFERRL